jgi:predicted metal-binding membrane protein
VHGSFPSFLAAWAVMTATMLPTAAPAAVRYAHGRVATGRVAAGLLFALSYLAVWGFAGAAVFVLCGPHGSPTPATTVIAAGIYELTPLKRYFRRRCRDSAASGLDVGFDCVGSCLALMLAAMALGVTSAAGMSVVALLVAAQKLLPLNAAVDVPLALAIVGLGLLVLIAPSSVPALTTARI